MVRLILIAVGIAQVLLAIPVIKRLLRTAGGSPVEPVATAAHAQDRVSVVIPVLNERRRLQPCLAGAMDQGDEVREIIVADGGSTDGTQDLVTAASARDRRVRLVDAGAAPPGTNGKAHNLARAVAASDPATDWILTLDADTRPAPALVSSLLAHATRHHLQLLSAATQQRTAGTGDAILHPAMLTTLIYRFGIPGHATTKVANVQANGQCFLVRRALLCELGGFEGVADSICEDITMARAAAARGVPVGFYETGPLIDVEMYASWRETWHNWSRSLPMHDSYAGHGTLVGLATVTLVQALPLWLTLLTAYRQDGPAAVRRLNAGLLLMRAGTLVGSARAYNDRSWAYWLSPLADMAVAMKLWMSFSRRRHTWRGQEIVRGASS